MHYRIFLLLGTNKGNPLQNLSLAAEKIALAAGPVVARSSIYQTAPWGRSDQPDFHNQVIEIRSSLSPRDILNTVLQIEHDMGRVRREKWGPRIIDIDLLFYGDRVLNEPGLTVPHPGIPSRRFTLLPLSEIAPDFVHPVLQKSVQQLLTSSPDTLEAKRLPH